MKIIRNKEVDYNTKNLASCSKERFFSEGGGGQKIFRAEITPDLLCGLDLEGALGTVFCSV